MDRIVVGHIAGVYGVRGWLRIFSETEPRTQLIQYNPLYMERNGQWSEVHVEAGRAHGKGLVAKFQGLDDRDAAAACIGCHLAIGREQLPPLPEDEYYWADLVGLRVVNLQGLELGRVDHLLQTGANDVLVVHGDRERLIPYVREAVIRSVQLEAGEIRVDWDPDF
ncbi:16S rRNA processing protein RimM [Ectothiorhodospira mobilis]|uniref:Ribosome maturation factor RimM n=1 Tax=Ectothiorhodospira mobilis TaxID=195064 RepID=A0A1I4SKE2_ECTMO|nr:ribosome maturation factor RimM [Ectothiorhodospira mobilis]SFM64909.1 16S rRNA processing protein RimM [Ectothiorhodospira mobilis]